MSIAIDKIAPPFTLSFGEEDGSFFAALIWPDELGDLPYIGKVTATVVQQGFVLMGVEGEPVIAFLGVSDDVLDVLSRSTLTLMQPFADDYVTAQVSISTAAGDVEFDYADAIEV